MRNQAFRYFDDVLVSPEQLEHIESILKQAVEDISDLLELVENEGLDYEYIEDFGLLE